jgi:hypothetical protein
MRQLKAQETLFFKSRDTATTPDAYVRVSNVKTRYPKLSNGFSMCRETWVVGNNIGTCYESKQDYDERYAAKAAIDNAIYRLKGILNPMFPYVDYKGNLVIQLCNYIQYLYNKGTVKNGSETTPTV